jgi:cardiolipin synthase
LCLFVFLCAALHPVRAESGRNITILVDAPAFFAQLEKDIGKARKRVYIQAMTIEADSAGNKLFRLLQNSMAPDKRIIVDSYIRLMISDRFVYTPKNLLDDKLQREVRATRQSLRRLKAKGVDVKYVNPIGPFLFKFICRNHKKMILVDDDIAYIGGINFSDHNFAWHDFMLRFEDAGISKFLRDDFSATWDGKNQQGKTSLNGIDFCLFDGVHNEALFDTLFQSIERAKRSVVIETPYLTMPFYEKLRAVSSKGVQVQIIAPENNNKGFMDAYTKWEATRSGFELRLLKDRMTHLKAILIDDGMLIVGSSNYDYISYKAQQELVVVIRDDEIVSQFKRLVFDADMQNSYPWRGSAPKLRGPLFSFLMHIVGPFSVWLANLFR